jgi:hypothetical protein
MNYHSELTFTLQDGTRAGIVRLSNKEAQI